MICILFVCLGNICRSPIAEATFRQLVQENNLQGLFFCDSAGTASYHTGELPDIRTCQNAQKHGIILTHRARTLSEIDFDDFDYIVAMDEQNLDQIKALFRQRYLKEVSEKNIFMLRNFDTVATNTDVPDPYYENDRAFEEVFQIVQRCNKNLLEYLKNIVSPI